MTAVARRHAHTHHPTCRKHPDVRLVCPVCFAARGGKTTAKRHTSEQLAAWGAMGGRPRKYPPKEEAAEEKNS
jgi:hypothetical protein